MRCVPIRLPDTITVHDSLPAGAAVALINRTHTYPDLVLTLNEHEKQWFDAIDGHRTIGEIVAGDAFPLARHLFERLWSYDQVVLDASR